MTTAAQEREADMAIHDVAEAVGKLSAMFANPFTRKVLEANADKLLEPQADLNSITEFARKARVS